MASKPLMTPAEVAHEFNVDPKTVTRWAKSGKLPRGEAWIVTPGGHRRYVRAYVENYLPQRPEAARAPAPVIADGTGYTNYLACDDTITGPVAFELGSRVHCEKHGVTRVTSWTEGGQS